MAINLSTEAALAPNHPSERFGARERKLLESVKEYVDDEVTDALAGVTILAAGLFTTVGGDATESITVTGAASTDVAIVTVKTNGATPRSVTTASAGTNAITVVLSGDPSTDHVLQYVVLRPSA
jgi:hypothetical protein